MFHENVNISFLIIVSRIFVFGFNNDMNGGVIKWFTHRLSDACLGLLP